MIHLALLSGIVGDTHIVHLELSKVNFCLKSKWSPLRSGFTIYSELPSFPFPLISFTAFYLGCDRDPMASKIEDLLTSFSSLNRLVWTTGYLHNCNYVWDKLVVALDLDLNLSFMVPLRPMSWIIMALEFPSTMGLKHQRRSVR